MTKINQFAGILIPGLLLLGSSTTVAAQHSPGSLDTPTLLSLTMLSANGDDTSLVPMGIALIVVIIALLLLYFTFKYIAKIRSLDVRKRFLKKSGKSADEVVLPDVHDTTNELGAAIGLALYFYKNQLHDNENTILTFQKAGKTYSPWSSKIYGIRKPLK
jgi:glutaconyl-CoA/methylmalonyl-CoA decarboxylase subunit delta